jgi:hypothetical protein
MSTTYSIKNAGSVDKAFKVRGGHEIVAAGKEREVTMPRPLTEDQIDALARDGVKVKASGSASQLSDLTVVQLKALAEAENIDLGDATKKDDIIAAIELAQEPKG